MSLGALDLTLIALYFALSLAVGLHYSRRASRSVDAYFLSERRLPWWLAGTSMVATTFAADTPLAVTGLVARNGVAGNWLWWNFVASGVLTVFLFAGPWRRSGVMTDVELAELRYSGKPAAFLRGFRALYLALPINCMVIGWVTLAMVKVLGLALGIEPWTATFVCLGVTALYVVVSGFWGVIVTDALQFAIAMLGSVVLAWFSVRKVGGMDALIAGASAHFGGADRALGLWPGLASPWLPAFTFVVYLAVQWWASWYPGAEPGGGGYVAQRIFAARDERHGVLATLWFAIAHYALRPWPWILTALATVVLYPALEDKESGYVRIMIDVLPAGWLGLMLASFAAAYMSTISTQLNWGSSYLINDVYRRFLVRDASERHYVRASRLATVLLVVLGGLVSLALESVAGAWQLLLGIGAGTGLVLILRWYWWRVSAWSEIAAMTAALVVSLTLRFGLGPRAFGLEPGAPGTDDLFFAWSLVVTVAATTVAWSAVTLLTPPEPTATLAAFCRKVEPAGPGWDPVRRRAGLGAAAPLGPALRSWVTGCVLVYSSLFAIGDLMLGRSARGLVFLAAAAVSAAWLSRALGRGAFPPASPTPTARD